jgi:uncharacterized protein YegP (UPF0339 family)
MLSDPVIEALRKEIRRQTGYNGDPSALKKLSANKSLDQDLCKRRISVWAAPFREGLSESIQRRCAVVGKFEVYKDRADKFRFRLKAGNGEIIAVSEAYNSKSSALAGVEAVRKNAPDAKLDDQTS